MLSPSISITTPEGANPAPTSSRRRALSYLRNLSQNRSPASSPGENPLSNSQRGYFHRTTSYIEPKSPSAGVQTRRRSNSRPEQPTSPVLDQPQDSPTSGAERSPSGNLSPSPDTRRARSETRESNTEPSAFVEDNEPETMARQRTSDSRRTESSILQVEPPPTANGTRTPSAPLPSIRTSSARVTSSETNDGEAGKAQLPTIRFFPHQEVRNGRPSLNFPAVSRTLPSEHAVIRVGRYSEREGIPAANPTTPSDAPVGFKSKVVSRKHCAFSFLDGQWHVKDLASSSGTFLNHIRLSQPNTESRLFPIKDGDIVQLGIDFRGGEEAIFRCVKIRIECNRSWQKKPNNFNKSRHAQLQSLAKEQTQAGGTNSGECSICLGSVLPCQSLFVAPCAHVWHYKCIRPLLEGKNSTYPQFQCPNCRAYTDLTAEVEIAESDMEEWMENSNNEQTQEAPSNSEADPNPILATAPTTSSPITTPTATVSAPAPEPVAQPVPASTSNTNTDPIQRPQSPSTYSMVTSLGSPDATAEETTPLRTGGLLARRQAANAASPEVRAMGGINMPDRSDEAEMTAHLEQQMTRTETPDPDQMISGEGPLTPRNNAGPFVFDGSAGRSNGGRRLVVAAIPEVTEQQS